MTTQHHEQHTVLLHVPFATHTRPNAVPVTAVPIEITAPATSAAPAATSTTFSWTAPQQLTRPVAGTQSNPAAHSRIADGTVGFVIGVTVLAFVLTAVASFVATQG